MTTLQPAYSPVQKPGALVSIGFRYCVNPAVKDSRWLMLEVCREFARNKCTRTADDCRFAHPPPNVEVQNGRAMCCFDSIKGRCQRTDPPCKYLHPPQHLKEQLLQNGRNNLLMRNLHVQSMPGAPDGGLYSTIVPNTALYPMGLPMHAYVIQQNNTAGYDSYYTPAPPTMNAMVPISTQDQSGFSLPMSSYGNGNILVALPPNKQHGVVPTSSAACEATECSSNGLSSSSSVTNGNQRYWTCPGTTALSPSYVLDGVPMGTTYYSPPSFFQGMNSPGAMFVKGAQHPDSKNGVTMYTLNSNPYQQMAVTSCYQPMTIACPMPEGLSGGSMTQRYGAYPQSAYSAIIT